MTRYVAVAKAAEVPERTPLRVVVGERALVLVNLGGEFRALEDRCSHEAAPLSDGYLDGDEIVCAWHGSCFDVRTGRVTFDPARRGVATYRVRVVGGLVEVEMRDDEGGEP